MRSLVPSLCVVLASLSSLSATQARPVASGQHGPGQRPSLSIVTSNLGGSNHQPTHKQPPPAHPHVPGAAHAPPPHQPIDHSHLLNGVAPLGFVPNAHPPWHQATAQHPDHVPVIPSEYHPWNKNQHGHPQHPGFASHPGNSAAHGSQPPAWSSNLGHGRSGEPYTSPYIRRPPTPDTIPVIPPMTSKHWLDHRPGPPQSSHRDAYGRQRHSWDSNHGGAPTPGSHLPHLLPWNYNHGPGYSRYSHAGSLPHGNQGVGHPYPGFPSPYARKHLTPPSSPVIPDELDDYSPGSSHPSHPTGNAAWNQNHGPNYWRHPHAGSLPYGRQGVGHPYPGFPSPYAHNHLSPPSSPVIPDELDDYSPGSSHSSHPAAHGSQRPEHPTGWPH